MEESTATLIFYMINLVSMVLMAAILVGVVIIQLIVYLEGSLSVDIMIFAHAIPQTAVLVLNLYIITLEDQDEFKFLKKG